MAHPPEQIAFSGNMGIVATMGDGPIGVGANQSIASGQPVAISDLLQG